MDSHKAKLEGVSRLMAQNGLQVERLIKLRQHIHQHPETAYEEYETQKLLRETMMSYGLPEENIRECAKTGLVMDIKGTVASDEKPFMVAIRADMDALPIQERNSHLAYQSTNGKSHACGHDGHMAMVLAAAQVLLAKRHLLPSHLTVRLLWQPAEEGPGGAVNMIQEGCLEGVHEVYGLHNIPNFPEGQVRVKAGSFFAQPTVVRITIKGRGGHGSVPHMVVDPIACAGQILNGFHIIKNRFIDSKKDIVFTITHVHSGDTYNVFADDCFMEGTIRSYDPETRDIMKKKIRDIVEYSCASMDCTYDIQIHDYYDPVINHAQETEHVIATAKRHLGEDYFSQADLPLSAGEDFSYFLQHRPGCFFVLGTLKSGSEPYSLHNSGYDFNDDMVAYGGHFWLRLLEHRLDTTILQA